MAKQQLVGFIEDTAELVFVESVLTGYIGILYDPVSLASNALAYDYQIPAGAIVGAATVTIGAEPAGRTAIANVARVRAADGATTATTSHVVDLGGLRTVSSLTAPQNLDSVRPWMGTAFSTDVDLVAPRKQASSTASFTEVATERLLVTMTSAATPDAVAEDGRITMHDPPADIELLVAGERVHFEPGPVRAEGAKLERTIDITAAVQRAVDAGTVPVPLELRSSVAATLSVTPLPGAHVLAHHVEFPEGQRRTVSTVDEGVFDVLVPLADDASTWQIRRLRFELQGGVGDRRVVPAEGPEVATGAELIVDPDRPIVVRLPPSTVRSFKTIDSLRLLVRAEATTELSGHVATETVGSSGVPGPGEPVADAGLVATTIEVGPSAAWVTLPLSRPTALDPEVGAWAVVQAARGKAVLPLAVPAAEIDDDALVLRQGANGQYRPLPAVTGVHTSALPLRVGGEPPPTAPIAALSLAIPGTDDVPLTVTPGGVPQSFELTFDPALTAPGAALVDEQLVVRLTIVGPGDHTIGPLVVGYVEAT